MGFLSNISLETRANLFALFAIVLWGTQSPCFSLLSNSKVPPFQILLYVFSISSICSALFFKLKNQSIAKIVRQPLKIWLLGFFGVFGFHFFYVLAFKIDPSLESYLIVTMWPLIMVVLAVPMFREKLSLKNYVGLGLAVLGVYLVLGKGTVPNFEEKNLLAYTYAFIAALIWALYSVLCKKVDALPKQALANFCFSTALFSLPMHYFLEQSVSLGFKEIAVIIYMGVGPLCLSFFAWEYGIRHGDVKLIGAISYLGPVIGTGLFIFLGVAEFTMLLAFAVVLILGGSFISGYKGRAERKSQPNINVMPIKKDKG